MASKKNDIAAASEPHSTGGKAVRSLRMTEETHDDIQLAKQAMGASNMDEALKSLVESYFLTDAKKAFPERSEEIADFEFHCRRSIDIYIQSLRLFSDAKAQAEEEVKALLESKDNTIMELQEKVKTQSNEIARLSDELNRVTSERDSAVSEIEALKKAENADRMIIDRFDKLQQRVEAVLTVKEMSPSPQAKNS